MSMWTKLKIVIVALFAVAATGVVTYHYMWTVPKRECEEAGRWWAGRWRDCASPIDLRQFPDMSAFFDDAELLNDAPEPVEAAEPTEDTTTG